VVQTITNLPRYKLKEYTFSRLGWGRKELNLVTLKNSILLCTLKIKTKGTLYEYCTPLCKIYFLYIIDYLL
jgi:hypothetical protein